MGLYDVEEQRGRPDDSHCVRGTPGAAPEVDGAEEAVREEPGQFHKDVQSPVIGKKESDCDASR